MKITLTELRNLVKNIIKEEVSKETNKEKSEEQKEQEKVIKTIKKMVEEVNALINEVNPMFEDSEDIHGVKEPNSTWETSYIYQPISFDEKKGLTIVSKDVYSPKKIDTDKISLDNLHNDGIDNLKHIKNMYNSAKRKLQKEKMK